MDYFLGIITIPRLFVNFSIFLFSMENELTSYWNEEQFVLLTYQQLVKDLLGLYDGNLSEEDLLSAPYESLHQFINQVIIELSQKSNDSLAQFIYKVDLNESKFQRFRSSEEWGHLAHEILRREAQKVYLRRKFSSSSISE